MSKQFYTTFEIGQMLSVTVETVRKYMKNGELEAFKLGRQNLVTKDSLDRYLDSKLQNKVIAHPGSKPIPVTARKPKRKTEAEVQVRTELYE